LMIQIYENYLRWPNQQEGLCANLILSGLNPLKGLFKVDSTLKIKLGKTLNAITS